MALTSAIEVKELSKDYRTGFLRRRTPALRGVSFAVPAGKVFGLLGANGSGKTTLIKIITGLMRPTGGSFTVLGRELDSGTKARMGYLPDKPHLHPFLTPFETLSFYADIFGLSGKQKNERIEEVLSLVGMQEKRNVRLRYFSRGMLQRVALAQGILNDPDLLILDEPIGALDPWGIRLMRDVFGQMRARGKTVLFSSHLLVYAQEICEEYLVLDKGRVAQQGTVGKGPSLEEIFMALAPRGGD